MCPPSQSSALTKRGVMTHHKVVIEHLKTVSHTPLLFLLNVRR